MIGRVSNRRLAGVSENPRNLSIAVWYASAKTEQNWSLKEGWGNSEPAPKRPVDTSRNPKVRRLNVGVEDIRSLG